MRKKEREDSEEASKLAKMMGVDARRVYEELVYLMAFSVGLAIAGASALSNNKDMRDAITDAYFGYLQQAASDMLAKGIMNGLIFYENYRSRVPMYCEAAKELKPDATSFMVVGNVYATYCGAPKTFSLAARGALTFRTMTMTTAKFLDFVFDKYRVVVR